jgi:hypothetical protein
MKKILIKDRVEIRVPPKRQARITFALFLGLNDVKWQRDTSKIDSPSKKYTYNNMF